MAQYYIFLALVPIALAGTLSALLLPRIVHSYQRFAWLRIFNYIQLLFLINNTVELFVRDPAVKQALAATDYLFLGSGPSIWLLFSLEYTGFVRHYRPWQITLFLLPAATCAIAFVQGPKGLVWRGLIFQRLKWLVTMKTDGYGLVALALFVLDYGILIVGAFILFRHTMLCHKLYRRQTAWLIMGIVFPLVAHFTYVAKLVPGWTKDFSSIAGALSGFSFSIGCLRHRLFAVVPVSRQSILQQMRVGMIVTDSSGTIIDLNEAACGMLGRSEISLLGCASEKIIPGLESKNLEISRYPLRDSAGDMTAWHYELRRREAAPPPETTESSSDSAILSLGELRVVEMLTLNLANKEISDRLGLSVNTIKFHLANVYRKTGTRNRSELVHRISEIESGHHATQDVENAH